MVQDIRLLEAALAQIKSRFPDIKAVYKLCVDTALLKQDVVMEDFNERQIGRILQYGHLHAHSLERATGFSVPHDVAVWCGIYIDLYLAGADAQFNGEKLHQTVLDIVRSEMVPIAIPRDAELLAAYRLETKPEPIAEGTDRFSLIAVDAPGCYAAIERTPLRTRTVEWFEIEKAWHHIRRATQTPDDSAIAHPAGSAAGIRSSP